MESQLEEKEEIRCLALVGEGKIMIGGSKGVLYLFSLEMALEGKLRLNP